MGNLLWAREGLPGASRTSQGSGTSLRLSWGEIPICHLFCYGHCVCYGHADFLAGFPNVSILGLSVLRKVCFSVDCFSLHLLMNSQASSGSLPNLLACCLLHVPLRPLPQWGCVRGGACTRRLPWRFHASSLSVLHTESPVTQDTAPR